MTDFNQARDGWVNLRKTLESGLERALIEAGDAFDSLMDKAESSLDDLFNKAEQRQNSKPSASSTFEKGSMVTIKGNRPGAGPEWAGVEGEVVAQNLGVVFIKPHSRPDAGERHWFTGQIIQSDSIIAWAADDVEPVEGEEFGLEDFLNEDN